MIRRLFYLCVFLLVLSGVSYADRDPFKLLKVSDIGAVSGQEDASKEEVSLRLVGIIWDKELPVGLIEVNKQQRALKVHDIINNYRIIEIQKHAVILEKNDKKFKLKLGQNQ